MSNLLDVKPRKDPKTGASAVTTLAIGFGEALLKAARVRQCRMPGFFVFTARVEGKIAVRMIDLSSRVLGITKMSRS